MQLIEVDSATTTPARGVVFAHHCEAHRAHVHITYDIMEEQAYMYIPLISYPTPWTVNFEGVKAHVTL